MVYKYVKRIGKIAKKRPGISFKATGKKPKLGSGERFEALKKAYEHYKMLEALCVDETKLD